RRPPGRLRVTPEVPGGSPLAGPHPLPRVLRWRDGRGPGRIASDGMDGPGRLPHRRVAAPAAALIAARPHRGACRRGRSRRATLARSPPALEGLGPPLSVAEVQAQLVRGD